MKKQKKIILRGDNLDLFFKVYLLIGGIHYTFDSFVKLYYYGFSIIHEGCKFNYFIHHIMTLIQFKSIWMLDHYPWFIIFCPAYHCIMVAFPKFQYNNHIYGISIACYVLIPLMIETFRKNRVHQTLLLKVPLIIIPIIMMATGNCAS